MAERRLVLQEWTKSTGSITFLVSSLLQLLEMGSADILYRSLLDHLATVHDGLVGIQVVGLVNHVIFKLLPERSLSGSELLLRLHLLFT